LARAKKTDRAEARRRARGLTAEGTLLAEGAAAGAGTAPAPGAPARPGLFSAFRLAARPVNVRADLRQIPWLVTRTRAVWLPSALVAISAIWFAASGGNAKEMSGLVFNLFVFPPPLAAAFLAGILTDRMSYLAGGLVGVVAAIVFSVYILLGPIAGGDFTAQTRQGYALYALVVSPLSGLAIGGFAGFYRRFLRFSNPPRDRQAQRGKSAKPGPRR